MTAAVYGLLTFIALSAGIFGLWLGVLIFFSVWRYCYSVLRAVAQGRKRIPPPDIESFNPVGEWAVFWHLIAFPGLVVATVPYQPLGFVVAVIVAITFPASAAVMGLTSSLQQAFAPRVLVSFARTLGSDYGALVLGCLAILGGAFLTLTYVVSTLGFLSLLASLMVEYWALLAAFALIGSALRVHRLEFEIHGELVPREEELLQRQHEEWHKVLDNAYASFRSGLNAAGYKTLRELVETNDDSLEVNHWLVENMLDWQDKRYGLEVAAKLIPRLLARGDGAGALELYRRCRRHDPDFRPPRPQAEQLAAHAAAVGQAGLADELSYNQTFGEDG
jgi:hypothetical protein